MYKKTDMTTENMYEKSQYH